MHGMYIKAPSLDISAPSSASPGSPEALWPLNSFQTLYDFESFESSHQVEPEAYALVLLADHGHHLIDGAPAAHPKQEDQEERQEFHLKSSEKSYSPI